MAARAAPPPPPPSASGRSGTRVAFKAPPGPPSRPPPAHLLKKRAEVESATHSRHTASGGAGSSAGADVAEAVDAALRQSTASSRRSVHGGFSGSKYDVAKSKSLGKLGQVFATSVTTIGARKAHKDHTEAFGYSGARIDDTATYGHTDSGEGRVGAAAGEEPFRQIPAAGFRLLDTEHLRTLRIIFEMLDTDVDGRINDQQLRTAVTAVGIPPTRRFLARIKSFAGEDGVDFNTFVAAVEQKLLESPVDERDIKELFEQFRDDSRDKPGHVTTYHLHHVLAGIRTTHHTELTTEEVDELLEELKIEYTDPVDYVEFVRALTSGFVQIDDGDSIHFS